MAAQVAPIDVALRFLAQRPRSEQEVRRRLQRAGTDAAAIETVLERLRQHALVDDAAFAEYWVEQRQTFKPRGTRLLRAELRQHGIEATAAEAAAQTSAASATDDAYRAARKRARQLSSADERAFKSRLAQFLARRGFDWETISVAVNRLWEEIRS
jgi:regulatory protein